MKETIRKANTCLPYGMVFTLIFKAAHINLSGEDSRQLHHTDTYIAKSLIRMEYHLSNGQWRKKISGQRADTSSSEDEEEDEEQPYEVAATTASTQEEEIEMQGLIDITIQPSVPTSPTIDRFAPSTMDMPTPPTMDLPTSDTTQTPIIKPSVSQSYIDNQMRQMTKSLTTSIGSMFEKFNQSVEQRFQKLSKKINQLKSRMDLYDLTTNAAQGPSTSSNQNFTSKIREAL